MSESQACARAVIGQLIAQGVCDIVLAPGSRSAGLALVADAAARSGAIRLHVRIDERSAGFLALGLAKASQRCVAVITTSGTAVGNLLPAVMEAHHSGIALLVLSADRPSALVGVGANQTTAQSDLFAGFLRYRARIGSTSPVQASMAQTARAVLLATGATGGNPGPVQVNVELSPPLTDPTATVPDRAVQVVAGPRPAPVVVKLSSGPRTVVVAGDATVDVGAAAAQLAEAARVPLIGEPSSNARRQGSALATGRLLLAGPLGEAVERVIVFGRPTLSRPVTALLGRDDVEVIVVSPTSDYVDPGWRARMVVGAISLEPQPPEWLDGWLAADAVGFLRVAELTGGEQPSGSGLLSGPQLARSVLESLTPAGVLCLGNSNPIRDADLAPISAAPVRVFANRGLAGIDGTVSTAVGIALACGVPTTLLCGDLSLVHDLGGLVIGPGEPRPLLRIVVADDGGGSIFTTLEYGAADYAAAFERVFATPTGVALAGVAAGLGLPVTQVSGMAELDAALGRPITGLDVVIVAVDRTGRRAWSAALDEA